MALSEEQLLTWANAPASAKTQFTYAEVRKALAASPALAEKNYDVYLQGSYANSTNTRIDSDVDIVVELQSSFSHQTAHLPPEQVQAFHQAYPVNATYYWADFRRDVIAALNAYFDSTVVKPDNKCVKLLKNDQRVNADIIPCIAHRRYDSFATWNQDNFVEGMKFWTGTGTEIINYPKVHLRNGEDKNAEHRTDAKYKHLVRIVKNIRRRLVEERSFNSDLARSYFVECAIYNVPDGHFNGNYKTALEYALDHILWRQDAGTFLTVSHQHALFGANPWQWNTEHAGQFFHAVDDYYKNS